MVNVGNPITTILHKMIGVAASALLPLSFAQAASAKGLGTEPLVSEAQALSEQKMHYVDAELRPFPGDGFAADNVFVESLKKARTEYAATWGKLPQQRLQFVGLSEFARNKGAITELQARLGLSQTGEFDAQLQQTIAQYRITHGLSADAGYDEQLIVSLNRGARYYLAKLDLNIERARAIPQDLPEKFAFVDVATQELLMWEGGRLADRMRVIVGKRSMQTPSLAATIKYAELEPYWNIPADLIQANIAPKAARRGARYLEAAGYQVLSDYTPDAEPVSPAAVDWSAVARGDDRVRVVQEPGPYNAMGDVKFMFPNSLGIYLHDTPEKDLFASETRLYSAGCVRLEDAERFAQWLFQRDVMSSSQSENTTLDLDEPVAVFITYFTAWPEANGQLFRDDVYGRDEPYRYRMASSN